MKKRLIAALAIPSLVLSGCSTLPNNSDPHILRSFSPQPEVDPAVGPTPGQEADLLVREFYAAAAIPSSDYGAARSFLCSEAARSEEHTSELQSRGHLVCRLLLEKKKVKR